MAQLWKLLNDKNVYPIGHGMPGPNNSAFEKTTSEANHGAWSAAMAGTGGGGGRGAAISRLA